MRIARLLTVAALMFGGTVAAVATAPSALAGPVCTGETAFVQPGTLPPVLRHLPTTSEGSRNTYCGMREGNRGRAVKALQHSLNLCYGQGIAEDGVYGPITRWAVATVQKFHGQPANGWYDPTLRKAMYWPGYRNGVYLNCGRI